MADLADSIEEEGFETNPKILVADTAACRNVSDELEDKYMKLGEERRKFLENVNDIYETDLEVGKMSEYIHTEEFREKVDEIREYAKQHEDIMEMVEKSVPESHREEERKKGFQYSFDEIATIIDLDFKIGPPREALYDDTAREISERKEDKEVYSVFLTPTFPLGKSWAYFFKHKGLEDIGITAYKAGSKGLHNNRIIVNKTEPEEAKELIGNSFISYDQKLPNPVLDIGIISEMAKNRVENIDEPVDLYDEFYHGDLTKEGLKEMAHQNVKDYILSEFEGL